MKVFLHTMTCVFLSFPINSYCQEAVTPVDSLTGSLGWSRFATNTSKSALRIHVSRDGFFSEAFISFSLDSANTLNNEAILLWLSIFTISALCSGKYLDKPLSILCTVLEIESASLYVGMPTIISNFLF